MSKEYTGTEKDLAEYIFDREDALPKNSVKLEIDTENGTVKEMFEMALQFFTTGMQVWYGNNINLKNISQDEFERFRKFFEAVGLTFYVKIFTREQVDDFYYNRKSDKEYNFELRPEHLLKYRECPSNNLIDHYFQLKVETGFSDYSIYVINFDFLKEN
jgi:hypothetical protein